MTIFDAMAEGLIYNPSAKEIMDEQARCLAKLDVYNSMDRSDPEGRFKQLSSMFASFGEGSYIEIPFYANWAGAHVHVGKWVYANFNLTIVDDGPVWIGDYVMIGPDVTISSATHPLSAALRRRAAQYNKAVRICDDVFIGAGAIICPGVTIGEGSVIGAGSVVTKDIPPHSLAYGNPCRVVREIGPEDEEYFDHGRRIDTTWL